MKLLAYRLLVLSPQMNARKLTGEKIYYLLKSKHIPLNYYLAALPVTIIVAAVIIASSICMLNRL